MSKKKLKETSESFNTSVKSADERMEMLKVFQEYRAGIKETEEEKLKARLLQLRYLIEDYLKGDGNNGVYNFGFFLKEYIRRINKKNKDFAEEISVIPSQLSQLINQHRKPTEEILIRLEIHSNQSFPAIIWYKILEKDHEDSIVNNLELRLKETKNVKNKLELVI